MSLNYHFKEMERGNMQQFLVYSSEVGRVRNGTVILVLASEKEYRLLSTSPLISVSSQICFNIFIN